MARFLRTLLSSSSSSCETLIVGLKRHLPHCLSSSSSQVRPYAAVSTCEITKSPFNANIIRILRNEINYQSEYAPPHLPATEFKSFTVQDKPGEVYTTMKGNFGDTEDINIEATMFDGCDTAPKTGEDETGVDVYRHISVLVDISKQGHSNLEFVCLAWPD